MGGKKSKAADNNNNNPNNYNNNNNRGPNGFGPNNQGSNFGGPNNQGPNNYNNNSNYNSNNNNNNNNRGPNGFGPNNQGPNNYNNNNNNNNNNSQGPNYGPGNSGNNQQRPNFGQSEYNNSNHNNQGPNFYGGPRNMGPNSFSDESMLPPFGQKQCCCCTTAPQFPTTARCRYTYEPPLPVGEFPVPRVRPVTTFEERDYERCRMPLPIDRSPLESDLVYTPPPCNMGLNRLPQTPHVPLLPLLPHNLNGQGPVRNLVDLPDAQQRQKKSAAAAGSGSLCSKLKSKDKTAAGPSKPTPGTLPVGSLQQLYDLSPYETSKLKTLFNAYSGVDRKLNFQEFIRLFGNMNPSLRGPNIICVAERAFMSADTNQDGLIDFDEYLLAYCLTKPYTSFETFERQLPCLPVCVSSGGGGGDPLVPLDYDYCPPPPMPPLRRPCARPQLQPQPLRLQTVCSDEPIYSNGPCPPQRVPALPPLPVDMQRLLERSSCPPHPQSYMSRL